MDSRSWDSASIFSASLFQRSVSGQVYNIQVGLDAIYVIVSGGVSYGFCSEGLRSRARAWRECVIYANVFSYFRFSIGSAYARSSQGRGAACVARWFVCVVNDGDFKVSPFSVCNYATRSSAVFWNFCRTSMDIVGLSVFAGRDGYSFYI